MGIADRPESRPESAGAFEAMLEMAAGRSTSVGDTPSPRDGDGAVRTIAILPFVDMSDGRTLGYFCEGIAEEIINALTAVPGLRVIARGSAFKFKSAAGADGARQIGAALNVATVLDGSVRAAGDRLRIIARLLDAGDGAQLWSERFERRLEDVFAVQDDIAAAVVGALGVRAGGGAPAVTTRPAASAPRSQDAYTCYLKGRFCWNQRTEAALRRSTEYFEAAIAADPDHAERTPALPMPTRRWRLAGAARVLAEAKVLRIAR